MAKNLKLNIKNTQIAGVFSVKPAEGASAKKKVATVKPKSSDEAVKPKVRLITPQKEEEKKEIVSTTKNIVEKEPLLEPLAATIVENPEPISLPKAALPPSPKEENRPAPIRTEAPPIQPTPAVATPPKEEKDLDLLVDDKKGIDAKTKKPGAFKDFKDFKLSRKKPSDKGFDARDKQGLRASDEEGWAKRRGGKSKKRDFVQEEISRPKELSIRLPVTIKILAQEMKLKASQLIAKLFMQGIVLTLNDFLEDETTVQLLGEEFGCTIHIDTSEQKRLQITANSIQDEISGSDRENLIARAPVLAFMGHVDHGKTSLIDAIRKSNLAASEAGAITQHIGAFKVKTGNSELTILDTPGHEAFTEMRSRGTLVTDIVVLVIAGDEGMREQTREAIKLIREAKLPVVVAINKCDKEGFNQDKIYRELADENLLPEAWGGTTITVNCSALAKKGISELLEMVDLQAEVLELKANPHSRARGTVIESQMHKGMGAVATLLVQNGTLKKGDAIVFGSQYGRVKTMHDEHGQSLNMAPPSTPVKITGLSGLAEAGSEFVVVPSEKEARELAEDRKQNMAENLPKKIKLAPMEALLKQATSTKKILPIVIRADVQGSLEALRTSLLKIKSDKAELNIISDGIGEISESDVELAAASQALILGFHTRVESHAESMIKEKKVSVILHNIIYHAVDDVKLKMRGLLDKLEKETDLGVAEVKSVFKSSHLGLIAGCQVSEGLIKRSCHIRQMRENKMVWKGKIASLKRVKEDVKEVSKGFECGILLHNNSDVKVGDILQAYEISYYEQEL